jgi:hypothetical protein
MGSEEANNFVAVVPHRLLVDPEDRRRGPQRDPLTQLGERHHQPEPERVRLVAPTQPSLTTWTLTTSEVLGLDQRGEALQQLPELCRGRATKIPRRFQHRRA